jgi:hypothetical protein
MAKDLELNEIKKLKARFEYEIVCYLEALVLLDVLERHAETDLAIKSAFKAVNKADNKRTVRKSRQVVK